MEYVVTVLEDSRREIVVETQDKQAAREVALLEARRWSGFPAWTPPPTAVKATERTAHRVEVLTIEPRLPWSAPRARELDPATLKTDQAAD